MQHNICSLGLGASQPNVHEPACPITAQQALAAGQLSRRHQAWTSKYKAAPRTKRHVRVREEATGDNWTVPKHGSYKGLGVE